MSKLNQLLYKWVSRKSNPHPLGIARIGVGTAFLMDWFNKLDRREASFDPDLFHYPWANWLPVLPPEYAALPFILWFVGAIGLIVGYHTRSSGAIALIGNGLYFFADRQNYSNHGYLLLLLIFLLTIADSGAVLAIDSRNKQPRLVDAWKIDLLKIQLSIVYFFTFIVKIRPDWLSGALMYLNLNGPLTPIIVQIPGIYRGLALTTLLVEAFLFWALWSKKWRELAFFVGLMLHVGILFSVKFTLGLISFGLLSISLYPLFLKLPRDSVTIILRQDLLVFPYPFRLLPYLDWLDVIKFTIVPKSINTPWLSALEPNGSKKVAFNALHRWLSLLPLTSLFSIIIHPYIMQNFKITRQTSTG